MKRLLALFVFLFCAKAGADVVSIQTPLGGINTHDPSHRISEKYSPYMRNVFIDDGRIGGINGFIIAGSTNTLGGITGIFPFYQESGNTTFLVTDSSVTLQTADFNTWVLVSSASNTGSLLRWLQVRNKMWGFNGVDTVRVWDGTNLTILNGNNSTPNVPKFKYGAYWQERIWGFNNPTDASSLDFSSVITTDAIIISPDDYRAWPPTNNLKIGQGNGEVGTALWVANGQLRVGKERSKYTIYGTGASSYFARPEVSNSVGIVSNDTVVNQDGFTYYLGNDGIYEDGKRISDLIEPDIEPINKGIQKVISNIWETKSDFDRGNYSGFNSTTTTDGLLEMFGGNYNLNYVWHPVILNSIIFLNNVSTFSGFTTFVPSTTLPANLVANIRNFSFVADGDDPGCGGSGSGGVAVVAFTLKNLVTGDTAYFIRTGISPLNDYEGNFSSLTITGNQINSGQLAYKAEWISGACARINAPQVTGNAFWGATASTGAQYISDVATISIPFTAWGSFDSIRNTNGGSIGYYTRSSTSVVNIATQTWMSASPGTIINAPIINNYIQWAATFVPTNAVSPILDNVTIDHIEGSGSTNRAFAISWKNRYWLATSTDGGNNLSLIYVKSKITNEEPNAWMPIEGINIRCFAKNGNDILYGGASSTGTVYRLDFGTNFNGAPIPYIYDTPDMILASADQLGNYITKNVQAYLFDAQQDAGLSYSIGSSFDGGAFSFKTVPFSGSGRKLYKINGIIAPVKTLRVRISTLALDKAFSINGFSVLYQPTQIIEPK